MKNALSDYINYSNCYVTIATKHFKWIKPSPVFFFFFFFKFYLHLFFAAFISRPEVFVSSVSSGISFSCMQPHLLVSEQSVLFH